MQSIVSTYQGSFSPPTIGHEDATRIIATKLYPGHNIIFCFTDIAMV